MSRKNQNKVVIFSPYKLTEDELNLLKKKFDFIEGKKIKNIINDELIAGVVIVYGSHIVDVSLKTKLDNFKRNFYENN